MRNIPFILTGYNQSYDWAKEFTDDILIYDRGEDKSFSTGYEHVVHTENVGNVDYDKLCYLVDNYDSLPERFVWGKANMFKYVTREEFEEALDADGFQPLLTKSHRTYSDTFGVVCDYWGRWYRERNDNWYFGQHSSKYVSSFGEWARLFGLPNPPMIPFAPGGNYVLTRKRVHKYARDFYENMASYLPYQTLPAEAHCAERSYGLIWGEDLLQ